jgi:hypothetical protein
MIPAGFAEFLHALNVRPVASMCEMSAGTPPVFELFADMGKLSELWANNSHCLAMCEDIRHL